MLPETISIEEARNLVELFYMHEFHRTEEFMESDKILENCGLKQLSNLEDRWFDVKTCFIQIIDKEKWFLAKIKYSL